MPALERPKYTEMCPPGYHVVKGHERICHSGTATWVDAHIRKNRGKLHFGLLKENIYYLFWTSKKEFPSLNNVAGYKKADEYDLVIQFWLDYWKLQGVKYPENLDPLIIKTLIAVESSFNPNADPQIKGSSAFGLMQITNQTVRILGGFPNKKKWIEIKNNLIHITKEDKPDPVINVAAGIRWLGYKYTQIPKRYSKDVKGMLVGYHSFDKQGELYADKIISLYEKSKGLKKK